METKNGFTKLTLAEFEVWVAKLRIARTIRTLQQHHTYLPNYSSFKNDNHFAIQQGMERHHVQSNGWSAIGQHFTSFPDGTILTGRSLESSPACIYGFNANSICIEHVGNFDKGKDQLTPEHQATIIGMSAAICKKFNIPVNTDRIVYHHWFNLSTGKRNNGTGGNKSCPGSNFFGGNKVADCEANFIPKIKAELAGSVENKPDSVLIKYVAVSSKTLNIRKGAGISFGKATDRQSATLGAILRVYEVSDNWYRISSSSQHWVYGIYTIEVKQAVVTAASLNARSGPGTSHAKVDAYIKGTELWIEAEQGDWCKVLFEDRWVNKKYLIF